MPAGPVLIQAVASVLTDEPTTAREIRAKLPGLYSTRAVRYALSALVKQGRVEQNSHVVKYCYKAKKEVVNESK
jgi:hypothetical protein